MTPREPDRFEERAREIVDRYIVKDYSYVGAREQIAAALRGEAVEALERAARWFMETWMEKSLASMIAKDIRALASPAAAPAAEPWPKGQCVCRHPREAHTNIQRAPEGAHRETWNACATDGCHCPFFRQGDDVTARLAALTAPPSAPAAPEDEPECGARAGNMVCGKPSGHSGRHLDYHSADSPTSFDTAPAAPSLLPRVLAALTEVHSWRERDALAAELRQYIAERGAAVNVRVEPCEAGGHYRNENGVTFHPSKCTAARSVEGK